MYQSDERSLNEHVDTQLISHGMGQIMPAAGLGKGAPPGSAGVEDQAAFQAMMAQMLGLLLSAEAPQLQAIPTGSALSQAQGMLGQLQASLDGSATPADLASQLVQGEMLAARSAMMSQLAAQQGELSPEVGLSQMKQAGTLPFTAQAGNAQAAEELSIAGSMPQSMPQVKAEAATPVSGFGPETMAAAQAGFTAQGGDLSGQSGTPQQQGDQPTGPENSGAISGFGQALSGTAQTAATAEARPTAQTMTQAPAQQVADQVQISLSKGENNATIRLQPEHLGTVNVRLEMRDGELHVAITAEQRQTGRLLNQQISDLRTTLESQGIRVADVTVVQSRANADGMQRDGLSTLRPGQMDLGGNPNQQQSQQQAAFTGDFQPSPGQGEESYPGRGEGSQSFNGRGGSAAASVGGFFRTSAPATGVDYYA